MQNLLPLAEGEVIHTLMPLPEDEEEWGNFHVMFATATGMSGERAVDFAIVKANGKIAMKLDEEIKSSACGFAMRTMTSC